MQIEVGHQVGIGIDVVLAAAVHLFLIGFHEVKHGGFVGELGVNGQRLHRHANGMLELRFGAAVINRVEQRFLLVVVFSQQVGIGRCEKGALFDVVGLAEGIHPIHVDIEDADQMGIRLSGNLAVREKLCERVAAVEVLGIPLFAFLEGGRFALLGFVKGQFPHRHFFRSERATVVGRLHIANDNIVRSAVADDMVHVEEPIDMIRVAQHFGMKQPAAIEFERLDEFLLLGLKVYNLFDGKAEVFLFHVDRLEGFAFVGHPNSGKESGVRLYRRLDGAA